MKHFGLKNSYIKIVNSRQVEKLIEEFNQWKKRINSPVEKDDIKNLKTYLKNSNMVLISNIWNDNANGQGYYGLCLKTDETTHRKPSSTAKKVFKKNFDGDILDSWNTIAKAAQSEGIPPTKMSRNISNNVKFDNYYYCLCD